MFQNRNLLPLDNLRKYGKAPFTAAVIHGGPGASGEMAPVAEELALEQGILEPFQTADSLNGQVAELRDILEKHSALPTTLIGYSWGAWLSFIAAAQHPTLIKKIILISSGPFEEEYAATIRPTRLSRWSDEEKSEYAAIGKVLSTASAADKDRFLVRLGELTSIADSYNPLKDKQDALAQIRFQADLFQSVWPEAAELRRSGQLKELGKLIMCPVTAIHGDYDPHPAEGVQKPLAAVLKNFGFILLENCGHTPWIEEEARVQFYDTLRAELQHGVRNPG